VLNRRRPLSLAMMRKLQAGLGLPADVLVQPYPTAQKFSAGLN
jgi:HTH-type transcriptional regulator/antitoxin HigA